MYTVSVEPEVHIGCLFNNRFRFGQEVHFKNRYYHVSCAAFVCTH